MRINNRSIFKPKARGAYKIEAKADESSVYLYDEISWWGINAEQFVKDMNAIASPTINLHVNSPGGSVFDGTAIFNAIKQHKSKFVAHVDGLAASIASVIIMAADEIRMGEGAFLMIHNPYSLVIGDAEDMRKEADLLDKVTGTIAQTYANKTGKDLEEIKDMMSSESWFTAQEALDAGLVDTIEKDEKEDKKKAAHSNLFDLSAFANVPDKLKEMKLEPTAREAEKALRDVGFSRSQAKAILSEGIKTGQRDVEPEIEPVLEPEAKRDVLLVVKKKDRVSDLLIRAEMMAPTK